MRVKMCAFNLIKYDPKTDVVDYGDCSLIEIVNIGPTGMSVKHNNTLKKGDMLEFRTKYSIEDEACVRCANFCKVVEDLPIRSFIGKVLWRNDSVAGLNFIMIHENDKNYLANLASGKI